MPNLLRDPSGKTIQFNNKEPQAIRLPLARRRLKSQLLLNLQLFGNVNLTLPFSSSSAM